VSEPLAYFITFTCYGSWLHGEEPGSVDRNHNEVGTSFLPPNPDHKEARRELMDQPPYHLDAARRQIVMKSIKDVCTHRGWRLLAGHVRSNHVHCVVRAALKPERILNDFKAYASRALNAAKQDHTERKRWTRHGSTRYLWTEEEVAAKIHYTVYEQGEPMEVYVGDSEPRPSEPRPSEPRPSEPRPSEPRPSEPRPSEPRPSEPRPSEPRPSEPRP
jgi:REP element-mobilizing transposase RayT